MSMRFQNLGWDRRLRFAGMHLLLSAVMASAVAAMMFLVWYPEPFRSLSGGLHLFAIIAVVDVMLGPLATLIVSSPGKSRKEWRLDMAFIALVQFGAMGYGVWTMYEARPVYLAFEVDRFRAIQAVDVPDSLLPMAPVEFRSLPKFGPKLIAVRPFKDEKERMDATLAALQGVPLGARPDLWTPYEDAVRMVLKAAKPVEELVERAPRDKASILDTIAAAHLEVSEVSYLPLVGRKDFWTVLILSKTGRILAYIPTDSFEP